MSDRDVQRELEANRERDERRDAREEDDGEVVDAAEEVMDPLTRAIGGDPAREDDADHRYREQNDAAQRPDE